MTKSGIPHFALPFTPSFHSALSRRPSLRHSGHPVRFAIESCDGDATARCRRTRRGRSCRRNRPARSPQAAR
jgi:hypothetical protein